MVIKTRGTKHLWVIALVANKLLWSPVVLPATLRGQWSCLVQWYPAHPLCVALLAIIRKHIYGCSNLSNHSPPPQGMHIFPLMLVVLSHPIWWTRLEQCSLVFMWETSIDIMMPHFEGSTFKLLPFFASTHHTLSNTTCVTIHLWVKETTPLLATPPFLYQGLNKFFSDIKLDILASESIGTELQLEPLVESRGTAVSDSVLLVASFCHSHLLLKGSNFKQRQSWRLFSH